MTIEQTVTERRVAWLAAESGRFDQTSIALHWLTAFLVVALFATAWLHEAAGHESHLAVALLSMHRGLGVLTWILVSARLAWRRYFADLPPFPRSMPKLQQIAAKANEYGLYALLMVQPITGLGNALLRGRSFALFMWQIPSLLAPNPAIRSVFVETHKFGAEALIILIGLHAGAALFHRLVLRDGVLQRMLPWNAR
jgi:cytochrome b561